MATKGQVLVNPVQGDSFEFLETAESSHGARVVMKSTVKTKGQLVRNHYHPLQDETFKVLSGRLTIWHKGKTMMLAAGQQMTLPRGEAHNHYNNDDIAVCYIHTVEPALDLEHLIENLVGLTADGKSKNGKFGLVQEMIFFRYLDSKSYAADIPEWVQNILMNTIAPIGRLFGGRAIYKKYSGFDK